MIDFEGEVLPQDGPDYTRSLPKLYVDVQAIANDPRRCHFTPEQEMAYDRLLWKIAAAPGARLPWGGSLDAAARILGVQPDIVENMLTTAMAQGLLSDESGYLTSPIIMAAYRDGVEKAFKNKASGSLGGRGKKKRSRREPEIPKKESPEETARKLLTPPRF